MSKGQIIFLNGASSSDKGSIAKALQEIMEKPCCMDDKEHPSAYERLQERFLRMHPPLKGEDL